MAFVAATALVISVALQAPIHAGPMAVSVPVPATVVQDLTRIPLTTWNRIGGHGAIPPVLAPAAGRNSGGARVVYVGAEFCPYCAALRWPLIAALSRFGTFTGLELAASSASHAYPSTPTFTFANAVYRSAYITFMSKELDAGIHKSGRYLALQGMLPAQAAAFHANDPEGTIPYLLVGGRYLWLDSPFSPALIHGHTWADIAAGLPEARGTAAAAIVANATEITAAVCAADGDRPISVCRSRGVQAIREELP
jgi:Domain of unknown function (DUF929)